MIVPSYFNLPAMCVAIFGICMLLRCLPTLSPARSRFVRSFDHKSVNMYFNVVLDSARRYREMLLLERDITPAAPACGDDADGDSNACDAEEKGPAACF